MFMFSRFYKGFTVQQTEKGWFIMNFPNWSSFGPTINPGPHSTYQIAFHQIDILIQAGK